MAQHPVNYDVFHMTTGGVKTLAVEWLDSAKHAEDPFRALIFAWIAFNAWATAVTAVDKDSHMKELLGRSGLMNVNFNNLIANDVAFSESTKDLCTNFPIFDGRAYRRRSIVEAQEIPFEKPAFEALGRRWGIRYAPSNWVNNNGATWENCLSGIYKIRCNLFHGQKQQTLQSDRVVVKSASDVLINFIVKSKCFEWTDLEIVEATLTRS